MQHADLAGVVAEDEDFGRGTPAGGPHNPFATRYTVGAPLKPSLLEWVND
jgi:hypothetical protein